ncbi:MAG: hypothetical protein CM1200mP18_01980 [Gammaproteobacteria bacterium]|nr:MAG: hypothetical protein CM1200mP18_01980 [Gammaproteobacteria bacterium]
MTYQQSGLFIVLGLLFAMLIWGRIRYDLVAFAGLVIAVLSGLVDEEIVFAGFGDTLLPSLWLWCLSLVEDWQILELGKLIARFVVRGGAALSAHIGLISVIGAALWALDE